MGGRCATCGGLIIVEADRHRCYLCGRSMWRDPEVVMERPVVALPPLKQAEEIESRTAADEAVARFWDSVSQLKREGTALRNVVRLLRVGCPDLAPRLTEARVRRAIERRVKCTAGTHAAQGR